MAAPGDGWVGVMMALTWALTLAPTPALMLAWALYPAGAALRNHWLKVVVLLLWQPPALGQTDTDATQFWLVLEHMLAMAQQLLASGMVHCQAQVVRHQSA